MEKEDIAYCGLDCKLCKSKFADIREKISSLDEAFEKVNMKVAILSVVYVNAR